MNQIHRPNSELPSHQPGELSKVFLELGHLRTWNRRLHVLERFRLADVKAAADFCSRRA